MEAEYKIEEQALSYCESEYCRGISVEAEIQELEEGATCPKCRKLFDSSKIAMLDTCRHIFCTSCIENWRKRPSCPVCRGTIINVFYLSKPIDSCLDDIDMDIHMPCQLTPLVREYVECLNEEWNNLVEFMVEAQLYHILGTKGTEHLNIKYYENEGRLLEKGNSFITIKTTEGKTHVVICCLMANLSLRLVITKEDDFDFEIDDEFADKAVGYLNKQIEVCWRAVPKLLNRNFYEHIFVRKFEGATAMLLLCGFDDHGCPGHHDFAVKKELRELKQCNFDSVHFKQLRKDFPPLLLTNLKASRYYDDFDCCRRYRNGKSEFSMTKTEIVNMLDNRNETQ